MKVHFIKTTYFFMAGAMLLASCSGVRSVSKVNNYDDAYFATSDLNGRGFYADGAVTPSATGEASAKAGSYGQTYSDRLRNFGGSSLQPSSASAPAAMITQPCNRFRAGVSPWGYSPYMGYNSMMMGNPWMMGNAWGNPMMMGYNPAYSYGDPYWMYYNQMYNSNMYWGGGSFGGWNNNGWNNWSNNNWSGGSTSSNNHSSGGFVNKPKPASGSSGFSNSGVRRNNYQTGTPSSTSGRSSSWSSGSTTSGSYNNGSSGTSRSSTWTPSGNTQQGSFNSSGRSRSSNAVQGTSGRRR